MSMNDEKNIKNVAVFCGSSNDCPESFGKTTQKITKMLIDLEYKIIFGGGCTGLMGVVADTALEHGGHITGVVPEFLYNQPVVHRRLSRLIVVPDMRARKAKMIEMADAFLILPGGIGTLEELFEVVTLKQSGLHQKPVWLLSVDQYWDPLIRLIEHTVQYRFSPDDAKTLWIEIKTLSNLHNELTKFRTKSIMTAKSRGKNADHHRFQK